MKLFGSTFAFAAALILVVPALLRAQTGPDAAVLERIRIPKDVDAILVPVTFKESTYSFLLDTGATNSVFDASLRPELGQTIGLGEATTATGTVKVDLFASVSATIGDMPIQTSSRLATLDLRGVRETTGYDVRGILGMDVLSQYVIRIDWGKGELAFTQTRGSDQGTPLDITLDKSCPSIRARLAAWKDETFLIDTGCIGATGSLRRSVYQDLAAHGLLKDTMTGTTVSASGKVKTNAGRLKEISLGEHSHKNVLFSAGNQNLLGLSFLSRYVVTFDFPDRKMYLKRGAMYDRPELEDFSGLSLVSRNQKVIVESVRTGSAADRRGIRPQDELATLEGRPAPRLRLFGIRHLFCEKGRKVLMTIKRNGKEYTAEITLQ